ncbi:unnamed protein product, partial [Rotaria sp. Silwood1]
GFESVPEENSTSATKTKKQVEVKHDTLSNLSVNSSTGDDIDLFVHSITKSRTQRRLSDGKPYSGSGGRMTKAMEHKLSDCYGLAIRQSGESAKNLNAEDAIKLMERSCCAAFLHNIKQSDHELQHALCPTGPNSWCSYHKDKYLPLLQRTDPAKDAKRLDSVSENAFLLYDI